MKNLTQAQLDKLLEYWSGILFLHDWYITASIEREESMSMDDCSGFVQYQYVSKCATIEIMDVADYTLFPIGDTKQSQELSLVHELLHLRFSTVTDSDEKGSGITKEEHQLIHDMAKALVIAKRGRI